MAGEITIMAGAVVEAHSSPAVSFPHRSGVPRSTQGSAPAGTVSQDKGNAGGIPAGDANQQDLLSSILERAQNVMLSKNTTISFERDGTDGEMCLYVRDKDTGEVICRIPKKYLPDLDSHLWQRHEVDVRI